MKRTIIPVHLSTNTREYELELQEPGTIRGFLMSYRKREMSVVQSVNHDPKALVEEIPTLLVEIDPDAPKKKRSFAVIAEGQIIEADNLEYRGTTMSQAAQGRLFHLFEEVPKD